ncbi:putative CTD kinase subunit alpha [Glarea lozoyensis 74030]|uniref:cyclin-dependent kinase n=1 Tax=Glarea lozoyensis (strain ATCC 74030 / MF5533) TaxID=1104152 RepID=H0EPQ6_GLAL7|nr:putative CTD kinase subunit alpha [Glarea lozoyensis 74030]
MIDSWSNGDDRRDRRGVDRGVARSRTSRSPVSRRHESERDPKERARSPGKTRSNSHHRQDRSRDRSPERRRRPSRSPGPDSRDAARERNKGRELLEPRGSDKSKRSIAHHSPSSSKRRKSRSPSPERLHHKKSRREIGRSPSRTERDSLRSDKKRRTISPPPRKRSRDRRPLEHRSEGKYKSRESGTFERDRRGRSPSPRPGKHDSSRRTSSSRHDKLPRRERSPVIRSQKTRERSPFEKSKERDRSRLTSPKIGQRSPDIDRYEPSSRSRPRSPAHSRGSKYSRGRSPRAGEDRYKGDKSRDERSREDRHKDEKHRGHKSKDDRSRDVRSPREEKSSRDDRRPRDEFRSQKPHFKDSKGPRPPTASGANSIEVKSRKASPAASGANSVEVKTDKMNSSRGYYGGQQGYNPHQQMQAAFPLKPQYVQSPQVDPRQYSQSPQHHMTPGSYHGSPQAQSPYGAGRGSWSGQQPQPQYSPQPQFQQNFPQQNQANFNSPGGQQGQFYNNQSPPYQQMAPSGPMSQSYQQNFRGNHRGNYRGNNFNPNMVRGGRGGGRGGHFQNLHWSSASGGMGRGGHNNSGSATPQQTSPQQQFPPQNAVAAPTTPQPKPPPEEDDNEDLFRPSKELQVEEKVPVKKVDEEKMPPPSKSTPTGPQSSKFSFTLKTKSASKPTNATTKPDIAQKLTVAPVRKDVLVASPERSRPARPVPTEPASARRHHQQPEFREPPAPTKRMVKKIMKRPKPRPQLEEDFRKSDSVYYRKPGNESVVGSGTYGKVFKGVHVYTKNLVALKKIRMEGERDGFPVTAVREIKLLQSLKHRNIVKLHEVMVEKNDCFMVFEYLSHDLTGLLNHPTFKLEAAHKKDLAKQLFEGLDYLHRRGVLHRDIKAANILVSADGQLKIADFGLARFYAKRRQLDYTNRVITIWYRSPELLLEIFTKHAIFPGDGGEISQLEKIYAVLGTPNRVDWPGLVDMAWFELLRPSAKRPNVFAEKYKDRVTPAGYELLEAMFQYDPAKRPSASDVLEHPYFTVEEPKPRQVIELASLEGDWHEFESKALRKENERKDKEAKQAARKEAAEKEKEKKRAPEASGTTQPADFQRRAII